MPKTLCSLTAIALLLGGCATSSDVVPAGDGAYTLSKRFSRSGESAVADARADALREANAYCAKDGRAAEKLDVSERMTEETTGSTIGNPGAVVLRFRCVAAVAGAG